MQGRRSVPKTHRQVAVESSLLIDTGSHKEKHFLLDSRNSNSANPGFQSLDSRVRSLRKVNAQSNLGKEDVQLGAKISPVSSFDSDDGVALDLFIRLERGPLGKWEICWSKVSEVDHSFTPPSLLRLTFRLSLTPNSPRKPFPLIFLLRKLQLPCATTPSPPPSPLCLFFQCSHTPIPFQQSFHLILSLRNLL